MTYPFDIDFFVIEDENVISETYGKMPLAEYKKLCESMDVETFGEFESEMEFDESTENDEQFERKIFTRKFDAKAKIDDRFGAFLHNDKEFQRVLSPICKQSRRAGTW